MARHDFFQFFPAAPIFFFPKPRGRFTPSVPLACLGLSSLNLAHS
jgi:hypothetical protein